MPAIIPPAEKRCPRCETIKPTTDFKRCHSSKDGLVSYCKKCMNKYKTERKNGSIPDGFKRCTRCGTVKPYNDFFRKRLATDGYNPYCKLCDVPLGGPRERILPEEKQCTKCLIVKKADEFYIKRGKKYIGLKSMCIPCEREAARTRMAGVPRDYLKNRRRDLRLFYGLTLEEYDQILEQQNGVCAVCKGPETTIMHGRVLPLSVDHDVVTGRVRGLLCRECNLAYGLLQETPERALALYHYALLHYKERGT